MGGGGMRGHGGIPLGERVRLARASAEPACPARHCWVGDAVDGAGEKRPGLLIEWREQPTGWEGRVVYAALVRGSGWALVEEWVPASSLTPR